MKKWYRKGQLYKRGKRSLALLLSACLIGTMIPVTARAESGNTNTGLCEHHTEHTVECGYVEDSEGSPCTYVCDICKEKEKQGKTNVIPEENLTVQTQEQTAGKSITAWQWVDEEECLDPETGNLALPFANKEHPAYFDDVISFLPTRIQATVENTEDTEAEATNETITLGDWECDNYPEEGAYSGSYTFTAALPEGYALSGEAEALTVLVELGGAQMYENEESDITYRTCDSNGQNWTTATCISATEVTGVDTAWGTSDTDTWYVVNGTMDIGSSSSNVRISVSGNVHLILTDGCSLTIKGGIEVADGNSLTIYGQTGDTGSLSIQNYEAGNAGIGSASSAKCGTITINGGKVTAEGSKGAGIGGGYRGEGGVITINGGTVTATGSNAGAGIGSGGASASASGGTITINGGTVTATGGAVGGAGIGGGESGNGGTITINGGTVTATVNRNGGAGIGGGQYAGGGNITIKGGIVTATGGSSGGAGIGGGSGGASGAGGSGGTISISGGTVNATGGSSGGAGIGDGINGSGGTVAISNSFVMAGSISDTSNQGSWNGLVFEGDTGKAYGTSVNVTTDCTIPSGKTLEVAADQTISITETKTLTNEGTIYNSGTFTGAVTNSGTIHNAGTISGASGGTINHYSIERTETSCQSVGLSLKVNDTTFEDTVTYTLSDGESNVEIEDGNTLKVTDNGGRIPIPVTATFTVDSVSMTRTENVTIGHVLAYAVNSQTTGTASIKVTCDNCEEEFGTITLSAPTMDLTYDGNAKTATVDTSGVTGVTISTPTITYKQGETILSSAPVDAGTYTASITLGTGDNAATVSVEYTIEQATPTISWGRLSNGTWVEMTEIPVAYTGAEIAPDKLVSPTVTLVNGEKYSGEISYSYRGQGSSDAFTSGLPTEIGTYEVKASIAADGNYKEAASTVTLTVNWLNTPAVAVLTDQKNVTLSGDDWWAQRVTFTAPNDFTISNSLTDSFGTSFVYNEQTGAGGTEVTYYLKNSAGEIAQKAITVRIDKTAPDWNSENDGISIKTNKWKSLLSTISFGFFYKESVDVKVCASDSLSGVAAYYYYIDSTGGTVKTAEQLNALNFTEYTEGVSGQNPTVTVTNLDPNGNYIVYAYAVDAAGNRSAYVCSDGVVVDKTAPAISDIIAPSKEASTLTDTTAQISFTGSEAGTYFYMVKKSSETAPTTITDFATEQANDGYSSWTAKQGVSYTAMTADERNTVTLTDLEANTEYTLYLAAVDLAGNSTGTTVYRQTFATCKTIPTVADADMPKISGTYGQTVADMMLTPGTAKVGSTVITGAWTVTDSSASTAKPVVGTTDTYQVTFTPDASYNGRYDIVNVQVTPSVAQKPVTVTAENKTKTYGQENPDLTFTVPEGALVGTDKQFDLGVTLSCEATAGSPVKEGGYAITGTSSSANYDVIVTPGTLTIIKADAQINVGTETYNKTFGDLDFPLSDVTDTNTEANVQYEVATGTDVITVSNGTVTILKSGTATITVSLPASTNYNAAASKTITVNVAKKSGYTVDDINKSYIYSGGNSENIDLSTCLPANCGNVTYGTPQVNGALYTDDGQPTVSNNGELSYRVKAGSVGTAGTIKITVTTENYEDFTITVKVELIDKIPVSLKDDSSVTLQNSILTYGQALSTLTFNSAVFVDGGGNVVTGTLAWKTPDATPNAGTTSATWVFTPNDESYATVEDTVAITVNKATPVVTAAPTVAERTYHPTESLTDADLIGGTVNVSGSWSWQTAGIIPTVNNSGYVAVFTPTDNTNYETVTKTITVTVSKATPYIKTAPTATAITYGDTLGASTLSGGTVQYSGSDATTVAGNFAWKDSSVKPSVADSNSTTYRVVFNPSDTENYNTAETDITLTVNKADNAPNMPSATMNVAYSCKKVSDVTLPTGWVWQDADKDTALAVDTPVTATVVYNGADKGNYVNETVSVTITRSACDHANTEVRNAKEATCTETGYTGDTYCKVCDTLLTAGNTIPLADHQGGIATCTKKAVCTVCGKEYGTLDANNHVHTEIKGAVAATCTAGGYTGDTYCTDCGVKTKTGTATPALGHNYTGKVTTEPTTEKEGVRTYTCDRCGHSYTESIPKLPEQSHAHFHIGTVSKAATCIENGVIIYSCSCGDSYTENIPALGHHYVSRVTKQPTTGSEGVMTYTCDRCGHSYTRAIAKLQDTNPTKPASNKPASNEPASNKPANNNTANSNSGDNNSEDSDPEDNNPEDNKPDIGKPYIKDENGKEGWDVIKDEVDKTKDGDTVVVEMNGTSVVPGDVLDDIKGKDVTIVFDMGGGIAWSVNGKSITADRVSDIDFTVKADTNTIPVNIINNVTGERYSKQLSLSYDGEFGFTAVLSINMDAGNAGLYANLFYYNEKTGEMEFICYDEIAEDGTAELTFTHASDYAVVIDTEPMGESAQVDNPASESQDTETETTQTDAEASNAAWNPWWIIIIGIVVIVIGLGVFFVVKKKKSGAE